MSWNYAQKNRALMSQSQIQHRKHANENETTFIILIAWFFSTTIWFLLIVHIASHMSWTRTFYTCIHLNSSELLPRPFSNRKGIIQSITNIKYQHLSSICWLPKGTMSFKSDLLTRNKVHGKLKLFFLIEKRIPETWQHVTLT